MAVLSSRLASSRTGGAIGSGVFWFLAQIHTAVARGLRFVGRRLGRAVGVVPWPIRLGVLSALLGAAALWLSYRGESTLIRLGELDEPLVQVVTDAGLLGQFRVLSAASGVIGWAMLGAAVLAAVRRRFVLWALRAAAGAFVLLWLWLLVFLVRVPARLFALDSELVGKIRRNELWVGGVWAWVPVAAVAAALLLCLWSGGARRCYRGRAGRRRPWGDRVFADLACRGGDPGYRASTYWSAGLHLAVFFGPLLLRSCGLEAPYGIPKGSGVEVIEVVQVRRQRPKKKERLVLNMNSPILFHVPKIEDSEILEELTERTEDQFEADSLNKKMGKGGGSRGGWPHGMENAQVRFIRLKYRGGDWDQDMGYGADYNLLLKFRELTGFKIAPNTEAIEIHRLRRFPAHRGPPFVFITGRGRISLTDAEVKTLRWYCLEEGGMIFADNGGGGFNRSLRAVVRRVFGKLPLVDIASDDVIYRQPFSFPAGAPPLWHHSGRRALGVKYQGRWVVFYHQGDIGDAWKTGHSGTSKTAASRAYKMGINVMHYAFTQYLAKHYGG